MDAEVDQRRLFPWLAVAFGLGILVYFTGTRGAPTLAAPLVAAALLAATTPFLRARPLGLGLTLAGIAALLGFAAATIRVERLAGPILARTTIASLVGTIEALDEREEGARLIVRVESFGVLGPEMRPARVRVSYRKAVALKPGDRIAATARLLPPPEAARPGGYDFDATPISAASARWVRSSARSKSDHRPRLPIEAPDWRLPSTTRATPSPAGSPMPTADRQVPWPPPSSRASAA